GARALRREGWLRDPAGGQGHGRGDQEGRQAVGDPHLSGRGPRLLQRRAARRLRQDGRRRRLAPHPGLLPPAPEVAGTPGALVVSRPGAAQGSAASRNFWSARSTRASSTRKARARASRARFSASGRAASTRTERAGSKRTSWRTKRWVIPAARALARSSAALPASATHRRSV